MRRTRYLRPRKRLTGTRILSLITILGVGWIMILYSTSQDLSNIEMEKAVASNNLQDDVWNTWSANSRHLLEETTIASNSVTTEATTEVATVRKQEYPPDAFSLEDRRKGAVILHTFGLLYMFIALAIVCDEFFVPSLAVITDRLKISDDVAGATFMAAGGSAPELFTSFFGLFVTASNVGISTIVGSAVFNILFVIGMCAVFSHGVLQLTWWPLFRDVFFYSLSLIVLIIAFDNSYIEWFESLALLSVYALYVTFMKFNFRVERFVKRKLDHNKVSKVSSQEELQKRAERTRRLRRQHTLPVLRSANTYRHGALQLMIHTIDPISNRELQEKAVKLQELATKSDDEEKGDETVKENVPGSQLPQNGNGVALGSGNRNNYASTVSIINAEQLPEQCTPPCQSYSNETVTSPEASEIKQHRQSQDASSNTTQITTLETPLDAPRDTSPVTNLHASTQSDQVQAGEGAATEFSRTGTIDAISQKGDEEDEEEEPLDLSWPKTNKKRITYLVLAPIVIPLWLMLPDVRRPEKRKWFAITFLGSILWIGIYAYFMLWFAEQIGETIGIPDVVMGLTFIAAGTSIPDLITSVIVARKGLGDMAVSSSVGSNIFDITVGLPIPWLLYSAIYAGKAVSVISSGLYCSIVLLFLMLILVITAIMVNKWKMTKYLGITMFVLYAVFLTLSILLEYQKIVCPL